MRFHQKSDIPKMDKRAVVQILAEISTYFLFYFLLLSGEAGEWGGGGRGGKRSLPAFPLCGETARFLKREW